MLRIGLSYNRKFNVNVKAFHKRWKKCLRFQSLRKTEQRRISFPPYILNQPCRLLWDSTKLNWIIVTLVVVVFQYGLSIGRWWVRMQVKKERFATQRFASESLIKYTFCLTNNNMSDLLLYIVERTRRLISSFYLQYYRKS